MIYNVKTKTRRVKIICRYEEETRSSFISTGYLDNLLKSSWITRCHSENSWGTGLRLLE